MSKIKIRFGGVVKCDMVNVVDSKKDVDFTDQCEEKFTTYSMSGLARKQAAEAGWVSVRCGRVSWPGSPPMANRKKVDLCPVHRQLATFKMSARKAASP